MPNRLPVVPKSTVAYKGQTELSFSKQNFLFQNRTFFFKTKLSFSKQNFLMNKENNFMKQKFIFKITFSLKIKRSF